MSLCACGCGEQAKPTRRFVWGHHRRTTFGPDSPAWKGEAASYKTLHEWLNNQWPRVGVCEECSREGRTDYAFKHHPGQHTRNREDYLELCRSCHARLDEPTARRGERLRRQKAFKGGK